MDSTFEANREAVLQGGAPAAAPAVEIIWASTSLLAWERERLGKVWAPSGKWPVTMGVNRRRFAFEPARYDDLRDLAQDMRKRIANSGFAMILGRPREGLDLAKPQPRNGKSFVDAATRALVLDVDGLPPLDGGPALDAPEAFGQPTVDALRARFPQALRDADMLIVASPSTSLPVSAHGEPAAGRAYARVILMLSRPVALARQRIIVKALKALPGLDGLGDEIYSPSHFVFVDRPVFPAGKQDPADAPVHGSPGERRDVDVDALVRELGVDLDALPSKSSKGVNTGVDRRNSGGDPSRRALDAPPGLRAAIVRQVVAAIRNDLDREDWIHFAHAIDGSLPGEKGEACDIFLDFSERYPNSDPEDARRAWDTRGEGRSGFGYLMMLLRKQGTPEAEAALAAVKAGRAAERAAMFAAEIQAANEQGIFAEEQQGRALSVFTALTDEEIEKAGGAVGALARKIDTRKDPWTELRGRLRWSGSDLVHAEDKSTKWLAPGVAVIFGAGASTSLPSARRYVTDRHMRGAVTVVNSAPEGGKTALSIAYMGAIAAERPDLAGLDKIELPGATAIVAADNEGLREIGLRISAFNTLHGLSESDFKHPGFVFPEPGAFIEKAPEGTWVPSRWVLQQAPVLARLRDQYDLALVVVDTLSGVAGSANTASSDLQALMDVMKIIASELDCAVEIINHISTGAAKTDPTSMDAGLGARPLTGVARFIANLTKEGSVVRLTGSKASYRHDGPKGTDIFELKSVDVSAEKRDVRFAPAGQVQCSVGVIVPAQAGLVRQREEEQALDALRQASRNGPVRMGRPNGPRRDDHASQIVETALGLRQSGGTSGRMKAERIVNNLVRQGLASAKIEKRSGHPVEILVPKGVFEVGGEDETPY